MRTTLVVDLLTTNAPYRFMKNSLLYLLAFALTLTACSEDEEPLRSILHYDGDNQTAPFLDVGEHEAAARFTASQTATYQGQNLIEVEFYLLNIPSLCEVRVYGENADDEPGNLLYSADVTSSISANHWNTHTLSTPVEITGDDLWISIRLVHNSEINTIGCDFGPAQENGDWIISTSDNAWRTFRDVTSNQANINWNIRGYVE